MEMRGGAHAYLTFDPRVLAVWEQLAQRGGAWVIHPLREGTGSFTPAAKHTTGQLS